MGTHAHNVTISPNNQFLYVAAESSGEVYAFSRNTTTGALTAQGVVNGMPTCDAVVVSNNNAFLFAAYENAVEVFSIGASGAIDEDHTGQHVSHEQCRGWIWSSFDGTPSKWAELVHSELEHVIRSQCSA